MNNRLSKEINAILGNANKALQSDEKKSLH